MSQTPPTTSSQQSAGSTAGEQTSASTQGGAASATGPIGRQFPTRSYLSESVRTSSIGCLNQCLADITAVNMQLKAAHWNVKGMEFYQLHELFEDLIETFEEHIDTVAERASALGGQPLGTARDVAANTSIPQLPRDAVEGQALLALVADRLSILDQVLWHRIETASQQGDLDTADLLNEVSRDVSKALWFVEAHLQAPVSGGQQQQQLGTSGGQQQQQFLTDSQGTLTGFQQ